jgi:hypothetical protein
MNQTIDIIILYYYNHAALLRADPRSLASTGIVAGFDIHASIYAVS